MVLKMEERFDLENWLNYVICINESTVASSITFFQKMFLDFFVHLI
jgi:hypothetical protein